MNKEDLFRNFIEPSAEKICLFGIERTEVVDGCKRTVTFQIQKIVFNQFDSKLSRYLASVYGSGLPLASVEFRPEIGLSDQVETPPVVRFVHSVPDALAVAARMALGGAASVSVTMGAWVDGKVVQGQQWEITQNTIEILERALAVCRQIGAIEFLDISSSADRVLVQPSDSDLDMVTIDLRQGTIDVPEATGGSAWTGPIYGFEKAASQVPAVANYLSRARHAVASAKETAIQDFRAAAEHQIMSFNAALAGRPLTDHRLERVTSLVARLKAGLGGSLLGLSETAQMTALDWVVEIDERPGTATRPVNVG